MHQLACAALSREARRFPRRPQEGLRKIGFAPTAELAAAGLKRVIVSDDGQSKFVPVHDSDNAMIDSGQLKELAVVLSKRLKSVAVLTSVYDSDRFEFIVFYNGKQVDAAVTRGLLSGPRRLCLGRFDLPPCPRQAGTRPTAQAATRIKAYVVKSDLSLFNTVTYVLNDPRFPTGLRSGERLPRSGT